MSVIYLHAKVWICLWPFLVMVLSKSFEAYSLNSFEIAAKHPKQKVNVGVLGLGDSNCVIIAMTVGHALTRVLTL